MRTRVPVLARIYCAQCTYTVWLDLGWNAMHDRRDEWRNFELIEFRCVPNYISLWFVSSSFMCDSCTRDRDTTG